MTWFVQQFCRSSSVSLIMLLVQLVFLSHPLFAATFGIEIEFASEKLMEPKVEKIPPELYLEPLNVVRDVLGDPDGKLELRRSEKFLNRLAYAGYYKDQQGREWSVVPESVNTTGFDGFELVTPPLSTQEDERLLVQILEKILQTGKFGKGIRSSIHVTVGVSSLFDMDGDASKLADTILFIENHWPEIYAAISPMRYGSLINYFSIPLAIQFKPLLQEISDLPQDERSFARLKSIFESYNDQEVALRKNSHHKAWKYRAANYKKVFGLDGVKQIPVIEFRIVDFGKPEELIHSIELFKTIIERASEIEKNVKFQDRFENISVGSNFKQFNRKIEALDENEYKSFLVKLGLNPANYPKLGRMGGKVYLEPRPEEIQAEVSEYDSSKVVVFEGVPFTFGFEVEMWKNFTEVVNFQPASAECENSKSKCVESVRLDRFPFLDGTSSWELTGNLEVRSVPTDTLDTVISQMKSVQNALKEGVSGFHLHMRVPKKLTNRIPKNELNGWFSRISDSITAWRLQHRMHFMALRAVTVLRSAPFAIQDKGTLMVRTIGDSLDIEIRGYVDEVNEIKSLARDIIIGLTHPSLIQGFPAHQCMLFNQRKSLIHVMDEYVQKYEQRSLSPEEYEYLRDANACATISSILPLFEYQFAPYFSEMEKQKVKNENLCFLKNVKLLLDNCLEKGMYQRQTPEYYRQFRWRIKQWATNINLYDLLRKSVLFKPVDTPDLATDPAWTEKIFLAFGSPRSNVEIAEAAKSLLFNDIPPSQLLALIDEASRSDHDQMKKRIAVNTLSLIILDSKNPQLKKDAAILLNKIILEALIAPVEQK